MGNILNVCILIWKNFKLQLRHPWMTIIELLIPIVLMILLILIRAFVPIEVKELETVFDAYDLNSLPPDVYNISENINLYYAPKSTFLDDLMQDVSASLNVTVVGFDSEDDLEKSYLSSSSKVIAGVIFNSSLRNGIQDTEPINYIVRPESIIGRSWNLSYAKPAFPLLEITDKSYHGTMYAYSGFLVIQHAIAKSIISKVLTGLEKSFDDLFTIEMNRQPYPPYVLDTFYRISDFYFAAAFCLCYIIHSVKIAKHFVKGRETKLKKILLLMGLSNVEIWAAWFIKEFIFLLVSNIIMTVMLCFKFNGTAVFNKSDPGVVLCWLSLYSANIIAFAFFIATFCKKENAAVAAVCILFIISFVPYLHSRGLIRQLPFGAMLLLCLLPNTIFGYSVRILLRLELLGKGLNWNSLGDTELLNVVITMRTTFSMLAVNIAVYLILAWYIDVLLQKNHPWYFPLMASYWTGRKNIPLSAPDTSFLIRQPMVYEGDLPKVKPMIHVKNLTKKYGKSPPIIDNIELKAYKGKITALLGHNCSGKTIFMQMLCGALTPTAGSIMIKSLNVSNIDEARYIFPLLGVCPDYDVCLDEMTVEENLYFFCYVKGFSFDGIKQEVNHILGLFDLEIRKHLLVSMLTPSHKRRLSVAIALVGESEVVFLDEPTLSMDPNSQRITWDTLVLEKQTRAIFFTTSDISQAYTYADRIAVLDDGYLKCCGSPMFLKKKYDAGYVLTLFKEPEFNIIRIKSYISSRIPDVGILSDTEEKLLLKLPPDKCHLYERLLKGLEEQNWNIKGILLTETPLEKLFDKITSVPQPRRMSITNTSLFLKAAEQYSVSDSLTKKRNEGCGLFIQQMKALFRKKCIFSKRNKALTFSQIIILPLILILSNLMKEADESEIHKPEDNEPFDLNAFGKTHVVYGIDPSSELTIALGDTYASLLETEKMHLVDLDEENYLTYFIKQAKKNVKLYKSKFIIGAIFEKDNNSTLITAFYNSEAYHSPVISLLYIYNTLLTYYAKEATYKLHVVNKPLPFKHADQEVPLSISFKVSYFWAQDLVFGMSILMSSFVILLVVESINDFKKQQFIAGLNAFVYWFSSFLFDFAIYLIPCILVLVVFSIFETTCLHKIEELGSLAVLLLLHGISSILFIYCCTFIYSSQSTAYISIFLYYLLGLLLMLITLEFEETYKYHISEPLNILFSVFVPSYCVGKGIYSINKNCIVYSVCSNKKIKDMCLFGNSTSLVGAFCCLDQCGDSCLYWVPHHISLSVGGIGKQLIALALQPIIFILVLILLEMEIFQSIKSFYIARSRLKYSDEEIYCKLVSDESNKILSKPVPQLVDENYYLIFKNALKFRPTVSVGKLSFGVKKGKCFGFIGLDNSGKSTALRMIAGITPLSKGNVYVNGFNVRKYPHKIMDKIGFNFGNYSLLKQLTVEETLTLFAEIRGIPEEEIPYFIEALTNVLCIPPDFKVKHCNNIIRRKLTVGIAIIGMPPLILLEEPTAFMDPYAYTETIDAIKLAKKEGCTIVLSTQNMDVCEALCDDIGILVKGKLNYIGSLEQLKESYQEGVSVALRVKKTRKSRHRDTRQAITVKGALEELRAYFEEVSSEAVLKIELSTYLNYFVPIKTITWSKLFNVLEKVKNQGHIMSYAVLETTAEEIFSYVVASLDLLKEQKIMEFLEARRMAFD